MDDLQRHQRAQNQAGQRATGARPSLHDPSHQNRPLVGSNNVDNFRPSLPSNASPSTPRSLGEMGGYNNYYQDPTAFSTGSMQAPPPSYGSEYGHDTRQQAQGFGGYNTSNMMYNVPHSGGPNPVYDTQQYAQRQAAAMQILSPDVASTYFTTEPGSGASSNIQQAGPANVYQHSPQVGYDGSASTTSMMQPGAGSVDLTMGPGTTTGEEREMEHKWLNYQQQLGAIFQDIAAGSLQGASETLLNISVWLLSQVVDLGLTQDDATLHADRIKLWNDFNHSWLALGYRQLELMLGDQQLSRSQSLLSSEQIIKLGSELLRLCDGIERHGLVDYQYGVWEEQIESLLEDCLDVYDSTTVHGEEKEES